MARGGDTYVAPSLIAFESRAALDSFAAMIQAAVNRHDLLRTSVAWEGLDEPVQVVHRQARWSVETLECDAGLGDCADSSRLDFTSGSTRFHRRAPCFVAWRRTMPRPSLALLFLMHRPTVDHAMLDLLFGEADAISGEGELRSCRLPCSTATSWRRRAWG